jgi:hypothetical protein
MYLPPLFDPLFRGTPPKAYNAFNANAGPARR